MRINKAIAHLQITSRRNAENLILEGKVKINGVLTTNLAAQTQFGDEIEVENTKYTLEENSLQVVKFYKPKGCLTTKYDPENRQIIYDLLPQSCQNLIPIGRLDYSTEGLLLLTNSGDFARQMELPSNNLARTYRLRAFGYLNENTFSQIQKIATKGLLIEQTYYKPFQINHISYQNNNHWLEITIFEGKNREVRKIMEYFDLEVNRLIRTRFGQYSLDNLKPGQISQT